MAYVEKYQINYCDDFNISRKISILQRDYVGASTELVADFNPMSITYESSEDFKFSPIRPSTADINMIFDTREGTQFEEFWTADEREFKVVSYKDGNVNWSGFMIPNGFSYEFKGGVYHASVTASDGLGTLEAYKFVDDLNKPYGNQDLTYNEDFEFQIILVITEILRKLGLDLDTWTCIDSYEKTMLKIGDVREADPLASAYVNVKTYINEGENKEIPYWYGSGEEWNCREVLENLLYIFGAKIYQESGVWRIKSTNVDVDYGTGATQRYWRKYNTLAVYLDGYEAVNNIINIPCNDVTEFLVGTDHTVKMDYVYKSFRMNYEYSFVRDGDTPVNFIKNGDFLISSEYTNYDGRSYLNIESWSEWKRGGSYPSQKLQIVDVSIDEYTKAIEFGTLSSGLDEHLKVDYAQKTTSLASFMGDFFQHESLFVSGGLAIDITKTYEPATVLSGDKVHFEMWCKYIAANETESKFFSPIFRILLFGEGGNYYVRNDDSGYVWESITNDVGSLAGFKFFTTSHLTAKNADDTDPKLYEWRHFKEEIGAAPTDGAVQIHLHGFVANTGSTDSESQEFETYSPLYEKLEKKWRSVHSGWTDEGGTIERLQITGVKVGVIPNTNELAEQQDFIYNNENTNYTYVPEPIRVFNGDVLDDKHLSGITVPTNTDGKNFWDDLSNTFGYTSLGLLTVKEIMKQYNKPYRILEGTVKVKNPKFGAVYTFETIPDVNFVLLRGSFNTQKEYIEDATFVEISSDELPEGGTEGGNNTDPEWEATGLVFCHVTDGLNTGRVVTEFIDSNPNSETYQQTEERVSILLDIVACPLNVPRSYLFNTDGIALNADNLQVAPIDIVSDKEVQISFNNIDGNYLYFVHLKTLGVVERIYTPTSPTNVLEDWIYLSDITIDGFTYRVLRTDYVMINFSNFTHNFKFAD